MLPMLVNHLWQSTLVTAIVAFLCFTLRNDGAHIRYWLWWAASAKFLVPFSLLATLGRQLSGASLPMYVPEEWTSAADRIAQPLTATTSSSLGFVLLAVWAAGSILVLVRWISRAIQLQSTLLRAEPHSKPLFAGGRPMNVVHTAERVEPCIAGIFVPVLLLPKGMAAHLTISELDAVIAHEALPCTSTRQPDGGGPHARRDAVLVLSARLVDRRPLDRRARASLRSDGRAARARSRNLRGEHSQGL